MKKTKKYLTIILSACIVLTNVIPTFAEINQEPVEEQVIQIQETAVEEAIDVERATPSEPEYDSTIIDLEAGNFELLTTEKEENGENLYYRIDNDNRVLHISSWNEGESYESFDSSQIPPWQYKDNNSIISVIIENEIHPSSMCDWFLDFTGLTSVAGLSCIGAPSNISGMFSGCTTLTTLDLSEFNISNVTDMSGMFNGCSNLETIYVQNFNTEGILNSEKMFAGCNNLRGGNGTGFNSGRTDKEYACPDKYDCPGYFTYSGLDQATVLFVSEGRTVCTRTVKGGDGITVPGYVRTGCDGWYLRKVIRYSPGDEFLTSSGESTYTLYDEQAQEKTNWQITFDDQEGFAEYSESSGTVSFTPAAVTDGPASITYSINDSTDFFSITDPDTAEITINESTPVAEYALRILATAAEDERHKETSKTIKYKLIIHHNAQTDVTLNIGLHGTGGDNSAVAELGRAMPDIEPPAADTGYVFDGYYDAESGGTKYYNAEGTSSHIWDKDIKSYTLFAHWTPVSHFDILIQSNNKEYGTVSAAAVSNVPYGTAIIASENVLTIGSTGVTAASSENTDKYRYSFKEWNGIPASGTVTADMAITAVFERVAKKHTTSSSSLKPAFTGTWGNPVTGIWTQDTNGVWHFRTNVPFVSTWGYIVNPYAQADQNQADWFWFDGNGCMLTGWRYINGQWYYLNPVKNGTHGACFIGPGRTPDGYEIDAAGAWTGR